MSRRIGACHSPVSDSDIVLPESSFSASDLEVNGESLGGINIDGAVTYYKLEHWNSVFMLDEDTASFFNVSSDQTTRDNGEVYNSTRLTFGKTKSFVKTVDTFSFGNDLEVENLEFGSIDNNTGEISPFKITCPYIELVTNESGGGFEGLRLGAEEVDGTSNFDIVKLNSRLNGQAISSKTQSLMFDQSQNNFLSISQHAMSFPNTTGHAIPVDSGVFLNLGERVQAD